MGGDIKGLQLAEFLVKRGRSVTIVEESETFWRRDEHGESGSSQPVVEQKGRRL